LFARKAPKKGNRLTTISKVLITGANGGIGKALTEILALEGFGVVATIRRSNPDFENWLSSLRKKSGSNLYSEILSLDVAEVAQKQIRDIIFRHPDLTHLVNNAAVAFGGTVLMTTLDAFRKVFEVNSVSQLAVSQMFVKHLMKVKSGSVLNVSSITASYPIPGSFAYGSSKLVLEYLSEVMSRELSSTNISFNSIELGLVDTQMLSLMDSKSVESLLEVPSVKRIISPVRVARIIFNHFLDSPCQCRDRIHRLVDGELMIIDGE